MSTLASRDPTRDLVTPAVDEAMPPAVLLDYQRAWIADTAQLKVMEKSRRIGASWGEAADATMIAAQDGGENYFYISATQDMAREFVEAATMWARAFNIAAGAIGEGIFDDGDDAEGNRRYIKTFELSFPRSGHRIVALSSRPTNLRGKQGTVGIDEAAFHPDLKALLKAALAMLLWGSKVRIWSTHDGVENAFNELIQEIRAGKRGNAGEASVHRVTFRDAVAQGLYRRVCMRRGIEWTPEGEAKWVDAAYRFYGDAAAEELDAIPSQSGGAYLSLALIESRMSTREDCVVVRGKWDDAFAYLPEDVRRHAIRGWCEEELLPHLLRLDRLLRHAFGEDFARNRDQAVTVVGEEARDLVVRPRITIELANCPFSSQEQIHEYVIDRLPRFRGGAMDATGNGAALAEKMAQRYGVEMVEQVKLNDGFYLENMPRLKAALQDGTLTDIPRDDLLRDDLRAIKLVQGVPKVPPQNTLSAGARAAAADGGDKARWHGDFAIALFLMLYAFAREAGEVAWTAAPDRARRWDGKPDDAGAGRMRMRPANAAADLAGGLRIDPKGGW